MPRARKPIKQHLLDGTYRADRHGPVPPSLRHLLKPKMTNAGGPTKASQAPMFPAHVLAEMKPGELKKPDSLSPEAGVVWDHVIATRGECLEPADTFSLVMLCEWWAIFEKARAEARSADPTEFPRMLPSMKTASDQFWGIARSFGLNPADRAKMQPTTASAEPSAPKVESRPKTRLDSAPPPNLKIAGA